ncbi:MAG TPA: UDP-N-acetylmuramate dehydrogenase [Chloroflexota bacterium]|jgi:UDP-N-acetylmuramate dehydrogenase
MSLSLGVHGELAAIVPGRLRVGEPLAAYTTLRVGGPADFLALALTIDEVVRLVRAARRLGLPWRIIGRGSNLLVADRGVRGLVIRNTANEVQVRPGDRPEDMIVRADAGVSCANLASRTARLGLAGFEFAVAIPGTVGGAVVQDAGAHGSQLADVLAAVECLDRDGRASVARPDELALGYRTSRFKRPPRGEAVLRADLRLRRSTPTEVAALIDEIRRWRASSQPTEPSAGSIFTNPPGDFAGRLIEQAGLKGRRIGGAQISSKHANFIVNLGGARAAEVRALIELARAEVGERVGVTLEPEVEMIGDWEEAEP